MSHESGKNAACELIVVRHGETTWNALGKQQGQLDSPLSPLGIRQAEAIAARLADEEFDFLYSSDLLRAHSTSERIAAATGHDIIPEPGLRERHLGIFQTLTMQEVRKRYPEDYARFESGDPDYVIPQGESARQRHDRAVAAVAAIAARHPAGRVVIVTHGGILQSLFRRAVGIPLEAPRAFKLYNASLNTFFIDSVSWTLGTWGDIFHLRDLGTMDDF